MTERITDLTTEDRERLGNALAKKFERLQCEACGNDDWIVNNQLTSPSFLYLDQGRDGYNLSTFHPSVAIHCSSCGNTKIFSLHFLDFDLSHYFSEKMGLNELPKEGEASK